MICRITFIALFSLSAIQVLAQTEDELLQQQLLDREQARVAEVSRMLDNGVVLMENEEYLAADDVFRQVLKKAKVVPTDLTFYFGKNSFYIEKYKQSIDWLNKYVELKGTSGRFYEECTELLKLANASFLAMREEERKEAQEILTTSYDIDCGPTGKVICPVCAGKGVIIQQGAFGNTYKTCPYSDDHGQLTCTEYNQLLRGELKPKF